jgi:hypothetical protein
MKPPEAGNHWREKDEGGAAKRASEPLKGLSKQERASKQAIPLWEKSKAKKTERRSNELDNGDSLNDEITILDPSLKRLRISGRKRKVQAKLDPLCAESLVDTTTQQSAMDLTFKVSATALEDSDESEDKEADGKATKSDDSEVKVRKWNSRLARMLGLLLTPRMESSMDVLRGFFLRRHKRRMTQSFLGWLHSQPKYKPCGIGMNLVVQLSTVVEPKDADGGPVYDWARLGRAVYVDWWQDRFKALRKNILAGRDALERLANTSWWDWEDGSRPLHWRWPKWYLEVIRDGLPVWFKSAPKQWRRPQPPGKTKAEHEAMVKKIGKVRKRRYIEKGPIESLTSFFAVPKGMDDIRMVYDGTKSGLNDVIWVPRFPLPTVDTLLRAVDVGTYMSDMDIGEMFLNFVLHESMQALCGVDLTNYFGEGEVLWERWTRAAMGLKSSPYQAVQAILVAKEVIRGDRADANNAFRWDTVRLNLPGSKEYDPRLPWVSKMRLCDGKLAADIFIYVDDARVTAPTKDECFHATRQAASTVNSLGIQEAARKRRWGRRRPGAWAGSIVESTEEGVFVTVSQEKWEKSRRYIGDIIAELKDAGGMLEFKELEKKRGFLIYVTRTYPSMVPYLKGIHQTLDSWRPHRDKDGWKQTMKEIRRKRKREREEEQGEPPTHVKAATRLPDDLEALKELLSAERPPKRRIRSSKCIEVFYGFGDASATGHAANFQRVINKGSKFVLKDKIYYRYGRWCDEVSEASSNYRELLNLVESLEAQVADGRLRGAEVFLFTDNSTAEAVFYKGNSTSRPLFELMLRLQKLEMAGELILHVIHVAGTRMVAEGADGGSRGDLNQGVMAGQPILDFVPLHLSALERSDKVEEWIRSWWDEERGELLTLSPEGWFDEGQKEGNFLWAPPPAAADVVGELLGEAKHKRPYCTHLVVVPRLMTGKWRRTLVKESDFWMEIPAGTSFWPSTMHEPLTLLVSLPLCRHPPWTLKGTPFLESLRREMRKVWDRLPERSGYLLRQLLQRARGFESLLEGVVREVLYRFSWRSIPHTGAEG